MLRSLLIANRGEIAVRIARTCRRLGIRTIAVYSDADRDSAHVACADEAIHIGPAAARQSYSSAEAILKAAQSTGADAIHPGYGFLSEKPDLAVLCARAGLVWVGPSVECIKAMGSKIGSKQIAAKAGVPSVPGYAGDEQSSSRLIEEACRIGFPVMIKASAGGGGRGMRQVFDETELASAIDIARREAEAAFGDPTLLIEKLILRARHLEVQVAGDKHGNVVHLFERDCSVQRNNQKVLEEAPAPNLAPSIRSKLLDRGTALARAIGYDSLGTVEFILEQGQDEPWFLEMNTRLQVEHTVTEAITGLDLVEWQIRIACGETLPLRQDAIQVSGHAIEARITAEEADHGFRPASGRVVTYNEPPFIRVDSGICEGSEITLFYDSLLAKVIASGSSRDEARTKLAEALRKFTILGPATTTSFLVDAVQNPTFAAGKATTRFIEEAFPDGWKPTRSHAAIALSAAAGLVVTGAKPKDHSPWSTLRGFRVLAPAGDLATVNLEAKHEETTTKLTVTALMDGRFRVVNPDSAVEMGLRCQGAIFEAEVNGHITRGMYHRFDDVVWLTVGGESYRWNVKLAVQAATSGGEASCGSGDVLAPMPGIVAEVKATVGDAVEAGQVVAILESMKLFMALNSNIAGTVVHIACRAGETVAAGTLLIGIEAHPTN